MAGPLRVEPDVEVARWVQAALADANSIATCVPPIFDAYARILHPASLQTPTDATDAWGNAEFATRELSWAEAALLIGDRLGKRENHTAWLARFGQVSHPHPGGGRFVDGHVLPDGSSIDEPHQGDIPLALLTALAELLLEEHGDAEVLAAVWEGSGLDERGTGWYMAWSGDESPLARLLAERKLQREQQAAHRASVDPAVTEAMRRQHVLGLPGEGQGRGHVLLRGWLATFADPAWEQRAGLGWRADWPFQGRTPNAIWPTEPHAAPAWFVATDLDLDVTLVGGSAHLIGRLLAHPALEAERVRPTDPLV